MAQIEELADAIRNNFETLVNVYRTNDGLEVRDAFNDSVISSIWNGRPCGVGSKNGTINSNHFDEFFVEKCYQSVREYFFE